MHRSLVAFCFLTSALLVACGPGAGERDGRCYGNNTCNDGLVCENAVCVGAGEEGEGEGGEGEGEEGEGEASCDGELDGSVVIVDSIAVEAVAGVCVIHGSLTIENTDITTLEPLRGLTTIEGALTVRGTTGLRSLAGLESVAAVEEILVADNSALTELTLPLLSSTGSVVIRNNAALGALRLAALEHVDGALCIGGCLVAGSPAPGHPRLATLDLSSLADVSGDIDVVDNDLLTDLSQLGGLRHVQARLQIGNNDALTSLAGLQVTDVAGDFNIFSNDALTSVDGLGALATIGGQFSLQGVSVTSLEGLAGLESVADDFALGALQVEDLSGLRQLRVVGLRLVITDCPHLTSLSGLDSLESAQELFVATNPAQTSLVGLPNGAAIGSLSLQDLPLTQIDGVEDVTVGALAVSDMPQLTSLAGLQTQAGDWEFLFVARCPLLTNLAGLEGVTSVGSLDGNRGTTIFANEALETLAGLGATTLRGSIEIRQNPELSALGAFAGVTTLKRLEISENTSLTSLAAFADLVTISENLIVTANPSLVTLGLDALASTPQTLAINNNCALPPAEVTALLARLTGVTCSCATSACN